ncbi:hypothetical protein ACP70R_014049 [Stipagrostis hirtigluma subsp. patula]
MEGMVELCAVVMERTSATAKPREREAFSWHEDLRVRRVRPLGASTAVHA